jgi:hypothetical protein
LIELVQIGRLLLRESLEHNGITRQQQQKNNAAATQQEKAMMDSFKKACSVCTEGKGYTVK